MSKDNSSALTNPTLEKVKNDEIRTGKPCRTENKKCTAWTHTSQRHTCADLAASRASAKIIVIVK